MIARFSVGLKVEVDDSLLSTARNGSSTLRYGILEYIKIVGIITLEVEVMQNR